VGATARGEITPLLFSLTESPKNSQPSRFRFEFRGPGSLWRDAVRRKLSNSVVSELRLDISNVDATNVSMINRYLEFSRTSGLPYLEPMHLLRLGPFSYYL
jgi:hypothetical protein